MAFQILRTIPLETELVIFDFYGTLILRDGRNIRARKNAQELVERLKQRGTKLAISSDMIKHDIEELLELTGIGNRFDGIYDSRYVFYQNGVRLKDLGQIYRDMKVPPEKSVMVGDSHGISNQHEGIDLRSARYFSIPFVPPRDDLLMLLLR